MLQNCEMEMAGRKQDSRGFSRVASAGEAGPPPPPLLPPPSSTLTRLVVVAHPDGLHVRPASAVAGAARKYLSRITLVCGDRRVDARNAFDLLSLAATQGTELVIEADGPDAAEALESIAQVLTVPRADVACQ